MAVIGLTQFCRVENCSHLRPLHTHHTNPAPPVLIDMNRDRYFSTTSLVAKKLITMEIVNCILHNGRFLKKEGGKWIVVADDRARLKVASALQYRQRCEQTKGETGLLPLEPVVEQPRQRTTSEPLPQHSSTELSAREITETGLPHVGHNIIRKLRDHNISDRGGVAALPQENALSHGSSALNIVRSFSGDNLQAVGVHNTHPLTLLESFTLHGQRYQPRSQEAVSVSERYLLQSHTGRNHARAPTSVGGTRSEEYIDHVDSHFLESSNTIDFSVALPGADRLDPPSLRTSTSIGSFASTHLDSEMDLGKEELDW